MSNESPKWLQAYYGPDFEILNPVIVQQGQTKAIVRLMKTSRSKGNFSSVGYVLIKMGGRHIATPHMSLHEGVASTDDLAKMQAILAQEDGT